MMLIIEKIKKNGIRKSIIKVVEHIMMASNVVTFTLCKLLPINKKLVVLESEEDLSDNAYALYDYMCKNGFLKKYRVVWLVDNVEAASKKVAENTKCVKKFPNKLEIMRSYYLATCGWYIFDHCNVMAQLKKKSEQKLIYLSHGWGYKAAKGIELKKNVTRPDYITATGELSAIGLADYWNEPIDKILITGYPRIDYLYEFNDDVTKQINDKWGFNKYKKVIFWMPTFRQSKSSWLSENYISNQTGLPIFETLELLQKFSDFLTTRGILLVFKLHHLQAELPVFNRKFSNIIIVRDTDLYIMGIQLYQVLRFADAIISDYSSITIDYMVMNRPLIYTLDDYASYDKSRGLYPPNAIDYMPGYHVYNVVELEDSIKEICCEEKDRFELERKKISKRYHEYFDGNSAKRILKYLGITMDAISKDVISQ